MSLEKQAAWVESLRQRQQRLDDERLEREAKERADAAYVAENEFRPGLFVPAQPGTGIIIGERWNAEKQEVAPFFSARRILIGDAGHRRYVLGHTRDGGMMLFPIKESVKELWTRLKAEFGDRENWPVIYPAAGVEIEVFSTNRTTGKITSAQVRIIW